jgi:hypothetical protein
VLHVTVGRVYHDRRTTHDVIAGEQQSMLLVAKANMIGCVPGCMDCPQYEFGGFQQIAILDDAVRLEGLVLDLAFRCRTSQLFRVRQRRERCGAGRVIGVCVRRQDPANLPVRLRDDGFNVAISVSPTR